jgi:hypothetical protein
VPPFVLSLFETARAVRSAAVLSLVNGLLRAADRIAPSHVEAEQYLAAMKPDLVVFTSLLDDDSDSLDFVKAARARNIPSALVVAGRDDLSGKGLVQLGADQAIVWKPQGLETSCSPLAVEALESLMRNRRRRRALDRGALLVPVRALMMPLVLALHAWIALARRAASTVSAPERGVALIHRHRLRRSAPTQSRVVKPPRSAWERQNEEEQQQRLLDHRLEKQQRAAQAKAAQIQRKTEREQQRAAEREQRILRRRDEERQIKEKRRQEREPCSAEKRVVDVECRDAHCREPRE